MLSHHYSPKEVEKEEQRRRTEKDLEGTELTPLETGLAGVGGGALLASGTAWKLLLRTMMAPLPESAGLACLFGAVAGAITSTGLWAARGGARDWDFNRRILFQGTSSPLGAFASLI
jgi:hypothetical protein